MNNTNSYRQPGITFSFDGKAKIILWAPYAKKAAIVLPERQLIIPLIQKGQGLLGVGI
jgi:hypothetical protein